MHAECTDGIYTTNILPFLDYVDYVYDAEIKFFDNLNQFTTNKAFCIK